MMGRLARWLAVLIAAAPFVGCYVWSWFVMPGRHATDVGWLNDKPVGFTITAVVVFAVTFMVVGLCWVVAIRALWEWGQK